MEYFDVPRCQITKRLGIAKSTLYRWLNEFDSIIKNKRKPINKTPKELARLVWTIHKSNPDWGRHRISLQIALLGVFLSASTVRNILNSPYPPMNKKSSLENTAEELGRINPIKANHPNHVWSIVTIENKKVTSAKLLQLSQVCLMGNAQITTQTVHELLKRQIPILYFTYGGWFIGMSNGLPHKNIDLRRQQFRQADSPEHCLAFSRQMVKDKITNCRTLLRRNSKEEQSQAANELLYIEHQAETAPSLEVLLGIEGNAARVYFQNFSTMLKRQETPDHDSVLNFDFTNRNRRPPKDPVNALLSYAYALLVKDLTITLTAIGLDPYLGFYHQPRYGRPALALDMMEPFRPLIADSVVITCINNGITGINDFIRVGNAVSLKDEARKRFIAAYERRMDSLITHPVFNYRISYRRVLEVQCRLLCRYLTGEIPQPPQFITR